MLGQHDDDEFNGGMMGLMSLVREVMWIGGVLNEFLVAVVGGVLVNCLVVHAMGKFGN